MVKYKKQRERRFEKSVCTYIGMEEHEQGITLLFDSASVSALRILGDELKNYRLCEDVEVKTDAVIMLEPDRLFFCEDELKAVMCEVFEEIGFDLYFAM
ncbi:hypothetical protein [uncultured Bacteroides sp.]|uniref:hypothetical protein n=1 Tax=uncultured Bacteroides sp. TaxID=162156 RepID=UPI00260510BF|nr:hypothetical protein [uncultured Bacteroides sp.]